MVNLKHPYAWLFCAFAALGACLYGYDGVYFTGVTAMDVFIEHFGTKGADGTYAISSSQLSLMTSVINIGELVGSLSAAPLNDYLGRKGVFAIASLVLIVGVILQLAADHQTGMIIGGRILLGYGVGNLSATSPLYIGEIAPTAIRGQLLMCWQLVLSVSQIIAAGINRGTEGLKTTTAYRVPMGVQLLFPLMMLAGLWWVPESPRWLLRNGKQEAAENALIRVHHGEEYTPHNDIHVLQRDLDEEAEMASESKWIDLICDPIERRKVLYSAGALIAQQINGIQWFYYFGTVFSKSIGLEDPFLMTLIVFIIQVVVVFAAVLCANKLPRRPLLLTTTIMMTISIFLVGCLGIPGGTPSPTFGKVIFAFIIIEITAFNFAWGPLGWTIASEMAVGRNRNKIYAIAVGCFWITVWATVFTLPYLYYNANLGPKTGFVYTGLCFISLSYVYFGVGEVTGRTIEEINGFFIHGIPAKKWRDQPRLEEYAHNSDKTVDGDEEKSCETVQVEKGL
ncbi:general substrate transporter [Mollisia scopiformis]|uniref:General substrate transporter n=1 Tax=Mollisia scopiformis TaxID=149040 RepID=A0A194WZ42_MOLSC|nr:general substrate transporter [Mollisia scopiformis]KUJ13225.1 general substrate transporter [Mollisia scopiformis]